MKEDFPDPPQFRRHRRVEFAETDMAGIVHFAQFYRYMEETEHAFFRSLGLRISEHQPDGTVIGWPRVSATCNFQAPAFYEDELEIRLNIARRGVKSLTINYEFWRGDTKLARGQMKSVCCHFRHGEPMVSIEIPPRYAELLPEASSSDPE